jgi:hypothetical protein
MLDFIVKEPKAKRAEDMTQMAEYQVQGSEFKPQYCTPKIHFYASAQWNVTV